MREFAEFPTEPWLRQRAGELGVALGLGLAFAVIGPFDTDESDFLPKLGYWAGLLACWFVLAAVVERGLMALRVYRDAGLWARRAALVAVASLPMLLVTAPATDALNGFEITPLELADMYLKIALLASGVVILTDGILGAARRHAPSASEGDAVRIAESTMPAAPQACRLTKRLPPKLQGPILCLEMEDHYVRVHTAGGSALILMRLGDAIEEAGPTPGSQSHRSWWVAESAIERFERSGRTGRIRLTNGAVAPVSQRYLQDIEALAEATRDAAEAKSAAPG